jgi:cell division control protein 6
MEALQNTGSESLKSTLKTISTDEKILLKVITEFNTDDLIAGDLYKSFMKKTSTSYASFDRSLNKLEFLRLIDTKFTGKGVKGNSRIVVLRFNTEEILQCLEMI